MTKKMLLSAAAVFALGTGYLGVSSTSATRIEIPASSAEQTAARFDCPGWLVCCARDADGICRRCGRPQPGVCEPQ